MVIMMMMKLPILVCAEELETSLVYRTKPRTISLGSQSSVSMARDLWVERIYRKNKF